MLQVLLVDGDPSQLHLRQTVLRSAGMVLLVATSAESALAFLRSAGSNVLVVDIQKYGQRDPQVARTPPS